jgi:hypothetical protein
MLIYSVCYYYGKNKKSNIVDHLKSFLEINENNKEFVLNVMIDSYDIHQKVINELSKIILDFNNSVKFKILTNFNWGGTILGLWMIYKYLKKNNVYIAHFEEDFQPINNKWYDFAKDIFDNNKDYIYIGETNKKHPIFKNRGIIKYAQNCRSANPNIKKIKKIESDMGILMKTCGCNRKNKCKKCCGIINGTQVWTDGGFYFTHVERLRLVEKYIGIFHKGDQNTKWEHIYDGVELGEIGFPTLLFHYGFTFSSIHRDSFFKHNG